MYPPETSKANSDSIWADYTDCEVIPVTVCVAAIFENGSILGISDRMITSGDIQFQPNQTKTQVLTSSIVAMVAGDLILQSEILSGVQRIVNQRIKSEPTNWLAVKEVAAIYNQIYLEIKLKRAEDALLVPLGLNRETFIERQSQMNEALIKQIASEMINYKLPDIEAIFTGVDSEGAQLYVTNGQNLTFRNGIGFASIGMGSWHANSQLMFDRHTRGTLAPQAVITAYTAKKRAEIAPGVGSETDMFTIGPNLGTYFSVPEDVIGDFDKIYRELIIENAQTIDKAKERVNEYLIKKANAAAAAATQESEVKQEQPKADDGQTASE